MKRLSTAVLTLALVTGVSGIALAASDTATTPMQPKPSTTAPAKPAMQGTMGKSMAQAAKPAEAAKPQQAKPVHHRAMVRPRYEDKAGDRDTAALNLLTSHGYVAISSFRQDGKNFVATVKQGGKDIQVTVDPDTHEVRPLA